MSTQVSVLCSEIVSNQMSALLLYIHLSVCLCLSVFGNCMCCVLFANFRTYLGDQLRWVFAIAMQCNDDYGRRQLNKQLRKTFTVYVV